MNRSYAEFPSDKKETKAVSFMRDEVFHNSRNVSTNLEVKPELQKSFWINVNRSTHVEFNDRARSLYNAVLNLKEKEKAVGCRIFRKIFSEEHIQINR